MPSLHRALLLTPTHCDRNDAFQRAAVRLGVAVVTAVDMAPAMAEQWEAGVGIVLSDPGAAVAAVVAYAEGKPLDAILAGDDAQRSSPPMQRRSWGSRTMRRPQRRRHATSTSCAGAWRRPACPVPGSAASRPATIQITSPR